MISQFRQKSTAVIAALALSAVVLAPAGAAAQGPVRPVTLPVVGTVPGGGTFAGTLTLTRFVAQDGQLMVLGVVSGLLTNAAGVVTTVVSTIAAPVAITAASCSILHLDLGPLDLNLLGLQVNLSEIVLDITAQSGAGNLLGNLLCTVTGLLDAGALAQTLNQILRILG